MFKDYIRSQGKRAIDKFKGDDSNLISYHTARKYDSYGGVLKPNILFLDIDTKEESEKLLKIIKELNINCNVLETTKGAHFYFERPKELEKNKIDWFSPIGITVTVKVGNKNVVEPLKIDGMTRKWIHKVDNCDYLPKWLYPIDKNKNYVARIEEGNRNQELFNLILKFQSAGLNKEEIKETIKVINKYVLKEPLPDFEIDTILRDEAFKKEGFNVNGKFQFNKFGDYLISEYHVIQINNVLHIYKDGIYTDNIREIETVMQNEIETLTITQRREISAYLQLKAPEKQLSSYKYIVVNNGVINIDNWELMPFTHHLVIKNKVLVDYMEGAYSPITDMTLNKIACRDKQLRIIFEEIFGYTLLRSNRYVKTILFTGNTRNGKSTLLKMMVNLIGNENTSSLQFKELDNRFKTAELYGKLANIGDDISKDTIQDSSVWKSLSSGGLINVERKGRDPFDFSSYATLIFSCNGIPKINDTTGAPLERLLLIPLKAYFTKNDKDYNPNIDDDLATKESMQYILQLALQGLKRLIANKGFSYSEVIENELKDYEESNNSILSFIKNTEPKFVNEVTTQMFRLYQVWCVENGVEATNQIEFSREVCKREFLATKQVRMLKKRVSIFVPKNPN
ncbi:phage/plasmid primase, P4 family [Carnobacterium maltaromaticum]|uniref:phage/plasmid primase, P4 family n=1 Tax=Carnobacterium maltaromaticum TaxID=2751 RepID=UPI0039BE4BA2